jgi:hypothetical protein
MKKVPVLHEMTHTAKTHSFHFHFAHSTATSNVMQKDGTLRSVANEAEILRKEVSCLQRYKDNHAVENWFVT